MYTENIQIQKYIFKHFNLQMLLSKATYKQGTIQTTIDQGEAFQD